MCGVTITRGFFQDDWRVATKLTLNLGSLALLDQRTSPTERSNDIGNFNPNVNPATTPALGQAGGPFPSLFNVDYHDFSPRFGLAWDVKGNGRTVGPRRGKHSVWPVRAPGM